MSESKYNVDELVPPSFLDEAYIWDVLKSVESDPELHLINYEIIPGSNAGDHFASVMFKIIASYGSRGKIVSGRRFVLKTMPVAEGIKKDMLEQIPVFKNEHLMYTVTLPAMEKILEGNGEKGWWPKLVYSNFKPFVLIFDDLTVEKYEVVHDPLDYDQTGKIVEKIAKFHALSKVLIEKGQEEITNYKMEFGEEMKDFFIPMSRQLLQLAIVIKSWPGYEEIGEKVEKYVPNMPDKMLKGMLWDSSHEFNVLNHGDFHVRNLMFKKTEKGELYDALFLDFQMPQYSPPAVDLIRLLDTIGNYEVRWRGKEVIKTYHQKLVESLKVYGYKGQLPTVVDIHVGMLRLTDYHVMNSLIFGPMFSLKGLDLSVFFNPNEDKAITNAMNKVFNEPNFVKDIQRSVTMFDNRGTFD